MTIFSHLRKKTSHQSVSYVSRTLIGVALILISTWTLVPRNSRNTLLVSVEVELSDTSSPLCCFSPLRPLILWALCLFPNIYMLFLKLKRQSQRFQLEKCGASECTPFNSRVISWVLQRGTGKRVALSLTWVNWASFCFYQQH